MNTRADNHHARATEEAADWFVANRADGPGLGGQEHRRFTRWLEDSPDHAEEYLGIAQLAGDLAQVSQSDQQLEELIALARASPDEDEAGGSEGKLVELRTRARRAGAPAAWRRWVPAALAAGLSVLMVGVAMWHTARQPLAPDAVRLATTPGEQRTVPLEDGSVLRLNTDTSLRVQFSGDRRDIVLERGQALFEVAHDAARPFVVTAGVAEVQAVGTAFDVYLKAGATQVTVTEGRVRVGASGPRPGFEPVFIGAGQQVNVREGQGASAPVEVDPAQVTAWMQRKLVFERWPLAAVVEEFNRYGGRPIEVASPELGRRPISGNFAVDDVETFLAYLRSFEGVRVEDRSGRIVVSRR